MELKALHCKICGGTLKVTADGKYKCEYNPAHVFKEKSIAEQNEQMLALFGEALCKQKEEQVANLRSGLWEAAHPKSAKTDYIDKARIKSLSGQILALIPDDAMSRFYNAACSENRKELCDYLDNSVEEEINLCADEAIEFSIRILSQELLLPLNSYIQRAYESRNPQKYGEWLRRLEPEAKKVDDGVYDVTIPRDVFIAYKSEDMKAVMELTYYLENTEGLMCFVAARNLQHGWISDYNDLLETAINNCRAVVFVSSEKSRKLGDARRKELPFVRNKDIQDAPPEYKQHGYKSLPRKYKKPRVEYVTEGYVKNKSANDIWVTEFFDGFERATQPLEVAVQLNQLFAAPVETDVKQQDIEKERQRMQEELARKQREIEENLRKKQEEELARKQRELEEELRKKLKAEYREKFSAKAVLPTAEPEDGYPTLENYDKTEFKIVRSVLKKYLLEDKTGEVKIPKGVTSIGEFAFSGCSGLTSITIPNSVTSIAEFAFNYCSGLTSITIPNSVTSIGDSAFSGCSGLTAMTVSKDNKMLFSVNNCIIEKASRKLVAGCKESIIPNDGSVTSIGAGAFEGCSELKNITIPKGVTEIGQLAFCYCSGLKSIKIPKSVIEIGRVAFARCRNLKTVTMPERFRADVGNIFWEEKGHIKFKFTK